MLSLKNHIQFNMNFHEATEKDDEHVFFPKANHTKDKSELFTDLFNK